MVAFIAMILLGQGAVDPAQIVRELQSEHLTLVSAALKEGRSSALAEIDAATVAKANARLKGVDPAKIAPAKAPGWAELFSLAQRHSEARDLLKAFLATSPAPGPRFGAQLAYLMECRDLPDGRAMAAMLDQVEPPSPGAATQLATHFGGSLHFSLFDAVGAGEALRLARRVHGFVPRGPYHSDDERKNTGWAHRQMIDVEATYLGELGRFDEAVKVLDEGLASLDKDIFRRDGLESARKRFAMMGKPVPELPVAMKHGAFESLAALRGKVVLIEFTAHW